MENGCHENWGVYIAGGSQYRPKLLAAFGQHKPSKFREFWPAPKFREHLSIFGVQRRESRVTRRVESGESVSREVTNEKQESS